MQHALLVDGDRTIHSVLARWLDGLCELHRAETVCAARHVLHHVAIDLILLEARLPDGSGLLLVSEIRRTRPAVPVIMLTAFGSEAVCAEAFRRGVTDYYPKPPDRGRLVASVRRLLTSGSPDAIELRAEAAPGTLGTTEDKVKRAADYLREHFSELVFLSTVAREVGLGRFTLSHAFTAVMRVSFRQYQKRLRMAHAAEFLADPRYSITEVAYMVGYSDLARFDKIFRTHMGVSPSTYRRHSRDGNNRQALSN